MSTQSRNENVLERKETFDEISHRFSELLVHPRMVSEDNTDDSDNIFESLQSCKNITFSRSRTYFDDEIKLFPCTPVRTYNHHPLLTSDEEDTSVQISDTRTCAINSSIELCAISRSPSRWSTPKPVEKSVKKNVTSTGRFTSEPSTSIKYKKNKYNLTPNDCSRNKENINATKSILPTLGTPKFTSKSPLAITQTVLSSSKRKIKQTLTPVNSYLSPNMNNKTPVSLNKNKNYHMSVLKRYSLEKASASAKQEFDKMLKNIKLKKGTLNNRLSQKEEINAILSTNGNDSGELYKSPENLCIRSKCRPINSKSETPIMNKSSKYINSSCYYHGSLGTPNTSVLNTTNEDAIKTPKSAKKPSNGNSLTGIKRLDKPDEEQVSVSNQQKSYSDGLVNKSLQSGNVEEDFPCTQPATTILLLGVVAYVEVRCGRDYISGGTKAVLESLGARVENNFTKKVTHCFFHEGKMSTYRKAVEWKVPFVSTLWIEACRAAMEMVPLKGYEPPGLEKYRDALPLYKLKTKGVLRRPVTDSKLQGKSWKQGENEKATKGAMRKPLPVVDTNKETDKVIGALHSVAGGLRNATHQIEKILTSPVLRQEKNEGNKDTALSKNVQAAARNSSRTKHNKKLFGSSSEDENNKEKEQLPSSGADNSNSRVGEIIIDSEVRISYDSDDLLVYAKKQAANVRSSAPPRLIRSRKCKKLLSSYKEPEKRNGVITKNTSNNEETNPVGGNCKRNSRKQPKEDTCRRNSKVGFDKPPQTKRRKLLLPAQVIATFEQDSGESTPNVSPRCPYKPTPDKKPKTGLAVKSRIVKTLTDVKVSSDCDSDDSFTRAARRESSALFIKKDKKINPQKTTPTIVCTSLCRRDVEAIMSVVTQLGTFTVENTVSERTTHVVTPAPRRTINLLKGIARGCWILDVSWVYKSLEVGKWLPEEKFELTEFSPSVKQARCDRQAFGPEYSLELFSGMGSFYVCRATVPPASDLTDLLRLGGGIVVSNARSAKIVIGQTPPMSPCGRRPPLMVKEKWVLDCITRLTQLPVSDYIVAVDSEP